MPEIQKMKGEISELKAEISRLEKVNQALMNRVERSTDEAGSAFALFENHLLLQNKLNERTGELIQTNKILESEVIQRKETMEALRRERNFVNAVLDAAAALIVVLDTSGKIIRFNKTCEKITGYMASEVEQKPFWDIFLLPEESERIRGIFNELASGKVQFNTGENYWITKDGDKRFINWSNTIVRDAQNQIRYIVAIGIDVTEHRIADEKMKLYHRIFMASSEGISISDTNGRLIECNPALQEKLGEQYKDLIGKPTTIGMDEKYVKRIWNKLQTKGRFRGETETHTPDGEKVFIDLSIFPVKDDEGNDICLVGMGRDITRQKKDQEVIRANEERFRKLVENSNNIIYSLSPDGHITYLSPKFEDYTGFSVSEYVNKHIGDILVEEDAKLFLKWLEEDVMHSRTQRRNFPGRILDKNKQYRWYVSNASVIHDELGNVTEVIGVAHDITEMKKLMDNLEQTNKELRDTQSQLVQSEKMASLGMLVAGIAHEINTPIGSVVSMHDTLIRGVNKLKDIMNSVCEEESPNYQKMQSMLKVIDDANRIIKDGSERVRTIVRRLRSFARLDEAELIEADIHEGLEDTLLLIHHEIKHNINIKRDYGQIPVISCYMARLNQVFLNLLINAKQAIREKGEITIKTYKKANHVYISFTDNGVGIPPHHLHKIFDPGFTTKGSGIGTGLGLSICYQIIQDHRGEILVESEVGKGTTFIIKIPVNLKEILNIS